VSSAILRDSPQSLTPLRGDVPSELAHIVERCLEKRPRERFQTAQDVLNELRSVGARSNAACPAAAVLLDKIASIAVLPFVNRSASADDEYFSDGLADELLNVLAKIKGLRVVARTSVVPVQGNEGRHQDDRRRLDVATVLEGSVRKAGQRGAHRPCNWSRSRTARTSGPRATTARWTTSSPSRTTSRRSVVKELRTTLLGADADSQASGEVKAEVSNATKGRATDPEAKPTLPVSPGISSTCPGAETTSKSIDYLEQALEREPEFAPGLVGAEQGTCSAQRTWPWFRWRKGIPCAQGSRARPRTRARPGGCARPAGLDRDLP
jgi:hypothetical protein